MTLIFASDIALKVGQRLVPGEPSADGFEFVGVNTQDGEIHLQPVLIVRETTREEWLAAHNQPLGHERYFYEIVTD